MPKPVTDEQKREMEAMRRDGATYEQIAEALGFHGRTVRRHAHDGRWMSRKGRRKIKFPELQGLYGAEYKREWRRIIKERDPEMYERELQYSRDWKARNKKRVAAYDSNRNWDKKHKKNGGKPPTNGKPCECATPLINEDNYCEFCGRIEREKKTTKDT